jgi:two-component sensor histidine kinase
MWIEFRAREGDKFTLSVRDDGIGFDASVEARAGERLGWQLIRALADQLKAVLEIRSKPGTEVRITFQQLRYKERGW